MDNVDSYFEVFEKKGKKGAFSFTIFYLRFIIFVEFRPKPLVVGNKNEKS